MSSVEFNLVLLGSLLATLAAYIVLSRKEGTYINILLPSLLIGVPAYYFFPSLYVRLFGVENSEYACFYIYATLSVEMLAFVYAYICTKDRVVRLAGLSSYANFGIASLLCLGVGILLYLPVILQFREFIFDPRQIYVQTRTGFGAQSFISSTLAYLAIILILFTKRAKTVKVITILLATALLSLHGSKGQVLSVVLILLLYYVYIVGRKVSLARAAMMYLGVGTIVLSLFAATMSLGANALDAIEKISEYSDYTRNAMLVIDSKYPLQYGRFTIESNVFAIIPRQLMPNKPKNFGSLALAEEFYPEWFDADTGSPAFGVGVQYADFGSLAIVYLALAAALKGWLARIFVNRLKFTKHPADFFMVVFLAEVSVFPVGAGWLLPEALLVAVFLRWTSSIGAVTVYRERTQAEALLQPRTLRPLDGESNA
jgi:hypothetical protein